MIVPLGADISELDFDSLPCRLTITEPRTEGEIVIHMNASALLYMLVGLIADLGEMTGRAQFVRKKVDVN